MPFCSTHTLARIFSIHSKYVSNLNCTADVVTKYAIHNSGKGFTLKKAGDSNTDVKTAVGTSIRDNIRNIYGAALGKELIEVRGCSMFMKLCPKLS